MESAVANLVGPGDVAVVASCGKFGQRWAELCDAYGAETCTSRSSGARRSTPPRSTGRSPDRGGGAKALFSTQSETSTGVLNDVRALAEVAAGHGAVSVFDAVSGLGVVDLPTDEWGVDVVVSGLAEGADVPARPGVRVGLGASAGACRRGPRAGRAQLLLRLGAHRSRASARIRPTARSLPRSR